MSIKRPIKRGTGTSPTPGNNPVFLNQNSIDVNEGSVGSLFLETNEPCNFAITGGADQALFSLIIDDLQLSAQDYDDPADSGADNAYQVQVTATSIATSLTTVQSITFNVKEVALPVNTVAPVISGDNIENYTLTATPGTWTGAESVSGQWYRDATPLAGKTDLTYTQVEADIGSQIKYKETATNAGGINSATQDSNVLSATISGIVARIALRNTSGYVADDPRWTYALASDTTLTQRGGYEFQMLGTNSHANTNTSYPKPLAGRDNVTGTTGRILVTVPADEDLKVRVALGNPDLASSTQTMTVQDGDGGSTLASLTATALVTGQVTNLGGAAITYTDWVSNAAFTTLNSSSGALVFRRGASDSMSLRCVEIVYPGFTQVTSGVGPYYVDASAGSDSNDGSSGNPWKHIPGDPAGGGVIPAFNVLGDGFTYMKKGQRHYPASYVSRNASHLQLLRSGASGDVITYGAYGSGDLPAITGDEVLDSWSSAASVDVFGNTNYTNIQKKAVSGVTDLHTFIYEDDDYLAPAQWPTPTNPHDFQRTTAGAPWFLTISDTDYATKVSVGSSDSGGSGYKACYIISDSGTNNCKDRYDATSTPQGYKVAVYLAGARLDEFTIDTYEVSTGKISFKIPNNLSLHTSSTTSGFMRYAIRYNPYDIRVAGQFGYSRDLATVYGHFKGSGTRAIARLTNGVTLNKDYLTFDSLKIANFGITEGQAMLQSGTRTGITLSNVELKHIMNSTGNWALYLNSSENSFTDLTITDLRIIDCPQIGGVGLVNVSNATIDGLYQRHEGRTSLYIGGTSHDIVVQNIDLSDQDSSHGNGPSIYQNAYNITIDKCYAMARPRGFSIQTTLSGTPRNNRIKNSVSTTRKLFDSIPYSESRLSFQGATGETDTIIEGCIFGISPFNIHPSAGGAASTGMIIRNCVISSLTAAELPGISFENCLIFQESGGGLLSLSGTGATDLGGNVFSASDTWDGVITVAMQQALTRNIGGSGYTQRSLGHDDYPWVIPAYGASFPLSDCYLTTTEVRAGKIAGDTFASVVGTQPGSTISLPAAGDNALFGMWKGQLYFLSTAVAGTYDVHILQTNSHPDLTGSTTKTTVITVTVLA